MVCGEMGDCPYGYCCGSGTTAGGAGTINDSTGLFSEMPPISGPSNPPYPAGLVGPGGAGASGFLRLLKNTNNPSPTSAAVPAMAPRIAPARAPPERPSPSSSGIPVGSLTELVPPGF